MKKNMWNIIIGLVIIALMMIPVFIGNKKEGFIEPKAAAEYLNAVEKDKKVMSVIGRDSCPACTSYKPIYSAVGSEYDIDIYYINIDILNEEELSKILHSDLTIPGKCHSSEEDVPLADLESVPLTLFTENGKVIDCEVGVVQRGSLIEKFTSLEMIKDETK